MTSLSFAKEEERTVIEEDVAEDLGGLKKALECAESTTESLTPSLL